ncbi:hypothetical protein EDB82DRAFT_65248 [Fusarium venenatum]|uniref:uncharacterized protein n=1 Tax=Fusarium venenatum TaxID=56646 RepID=UPI001DFDC972|nr:hypothetical protein EDB82DRAFT_65248 [Fusarium venenatum]
MDPAHPRQCACALVKLVVKRYPNQGRHDGAKWSDTSSNHRIGPRTLVFFDPFQGLLQERLRWTLEQLSQRILLTYSWIHGEFATRTGQGSKSSWRPCPVHNDRWKIDCVALLGPAIDASP